jgi:APA family basic amino acid/polyamine antiporter
MTQLVRTLRLRDLIFLFVGGVIGSGIFLTPGIILRQVNGSAGMALLVWAGGGVLILLGSLTYAELAATNPEAGGLYCYIRDGFGRTAAFLCGWSFLLIMASGAVAALSRAFSRYLAEIIPLTQAEMTAIAVATIVILTVVNIWGTRKSSHLLNYTTVIKVGIILTLGITFVALGQHGHELPSAMGPTQTGFNLFSSLGLAMITVLWSYEGWQYATCSAGEVLEPQKDIPRAFLIGALALTAIYVTMVVSYLFALGPQAATASDAIAATAGAAVLGPWVGKLIAVTVLISTLSAANGLLLTAPRVFYAMAKDNLFFKALAEVHPKFHTPAGAIICLGGWSIVLACVGKFSELIGGVVFVGWIFYGLGAAAIFPLRRKSRGKAIPYRVPGYPWTPLLFVLAAGSIVGNAIYAAFRDPGQFKNLAVAIVLLLLGLPAYFFWRKKSA